MVIRSSSLGSTVLCATALLLAGCTSNGQPAQQAQAEEEASASQPKPVVVSAEPATPASKPAPAPSATEAAAAPAVASKSPEGEPAAVTNMAVVDIYLRGPDFQYARWHVASDGTLRFAGDRFARSSEWGWTGQVTPAQAQSINAIAAQWVSARPKGDDSTGEVWEVSVQGADGSTRFTVYGTASSVADMWSIFHVAGKGHHHAQADPVPPRDLDSLFFNKPVQVEAGDE